MKVLDFVSVYCVKNLSNIVGTRHVAVTVK